MNDEPIGTVRVRTGKYGQDFYVKIRQGEWVSIYTDNVGTSIQGVVMSDTSILETELLPSI